MATPQESLRYNVGQVYQSAGYEVAGKKVLTSATTLTSNDSRMIHTDTTAAGFNVTLPALPYEGQEYTIFDGAAAGSWNTNSLTVLGVSGGSGKQIIVSGSAAADSVVLNTRSQAITLRYNSTSSCWHSVAKN